MPGSPRIRLLLAASALGALAALAIVATRGRSTSGVPDEPGALPASSSQGPGSAGAGSTASATTAVPPSERQQAVSRAMDKTMARSVARSYVESVDRGDRTAQPRLREALVAYKDVGVEVANEFIANDPHLSEAAKAALKEISAHGH